MKYLFIFISFILGFYLGKSQVNQLSRSPKNAYIVKDDNDSLRYRRQIIDTSTSKYLLNSWKPQRIPLNSIWTNLTWSADLGILVATSHSGISTGIMTSKDGLTWNTQTTPTNKWRAVAWSPQNKIFAAVSSNGTLNNAMSSNDGVTWTTRTTPNSYYYRDMIWVDELGLFVAVANTAGVTDKVITSPDGITWTARTCPDRSWSDIVWSPELKLLCVSATGGIAGDKIMTSPDAINWTLHNTPGDAASWEGLTWSGDLGLFVAVAYSGITGTRVMTSPNGTTWTLRNTPADQQWLSVDWSPEAGMFAAVCDDISTGNNVMVSTDGIKWNLQGGIINRDWRRILWVKELGSFVGLAYYDGSTAGDSLVMLSNPIDINKQYVTKLSFDNVIKGSTGEGALPLLTAEASNFTITCGVFWTLPSLAGAGGNKTITLPSAASNPGRRIYVWNSNNDSNLWIFGTAWANPDGTTSTSCGNRTISIYISTGTGWVKMSEH